MAMTLPTLLRAHIPDVARLATIAVGTGESGPAIPAGTGLGSRPVAMSFPLALPTGTASSGVDHRVLFGVVMAGRTMRDQPAVRLSVDFWRDLFKMIRVPAQLVRTLVMQVVTGCDLSDQRQPSRPMHGFVMPVLHPHLTVDAVLSPHPQPAPA